MNTKAKEIEVGRIVPSKTNRKYYDQTALEELAANIAEQGVLQPVLVRPLGEVFELVFGERRWRASKLAELATVPCQVRELSDREALEIQLVENLQREDVDIVEEGQVLKGMLELEEGGERVYSQKSLAQKLGKSKQYVQDRVPLANLDRKLATAVRTGRLAAKTAALLGRIPNKEDRKEVGQLVVRTELTFRQTSDLINREYIKSLRSAPFAITDPDLVESAGSCEECPFRSGNADPSVKYTHQCYNPRCYREKAEAGWQQKAERVREDGMEVLSDTDSRVQFPDGKHLCGNSSYVLWEQRPPQDILKPEIEWSTIDAWCDMLEGREVPLTLARVPDSGRSVVLAKLELCLTAAVHVGEGDIFVDRVLRAYAAAPDPEVKQKERREANAAADEGDGEAVLDKSDLSQKEAMAELTKLRNRVSGLATDPDSYVVPAQLPESAWKLLIQCAALNIGAQGRKLVEQWNGLDAEYWDAELLSGRLDGRDADQLPLLLLNLLVAEYEPAYQEQFLKELKGYVSPERAKEEEIAADAEDLNLPEGYRPAALDLPDDEVTCSVILEDIETGDRSEGLGYTSTDDDEVTWVDPVAMEPIDSQLKVIGWDYYEEEEGA